METLSVLKLGMLLVRKILTFLICRIGPVIGILKISFFQGSLKIPFMLIILMPFGFFVNISFVISQNFPYSRTTDCIGEKVGQAGQPILFLNLFATFWKFSWKGSVTENFKISRIS